MRIPRIYTPQDDFSHQEIELEKFAANHIYQVLRLKIGDKIKLFNGKKEYLATLLVTTKKQVKAQLNEPIKSLLESDLNITLAQALPRSDKMDFVLQKAAELGVKQIIPLYTERSQIKLDEKRLQKRLNHWQKVIISSCEQCGRCFIPTITTPLFLPYWIAKQPLEQIPLTIVAHPTASQSIHSLELDNIKNITVVIGPEGGFSDDEVTILSSCYQLVSLGPRILRTETAGIAMLAILQAFQGDI